MVPPWLKTVLWLTLALQTLEAPTLKNSHTQPLTQCDSHTISCPKILFKDPPFSPDVIMEYYLAVKRNGRTDQCYNISELWKHELRWKKPVTKGHICYYWMCCLYETPRIGKSTGRQFMVGMRGVKFGGWCLKSTRVCFWGDEMF